ncbi:UPF0126 domain protein [Xanthomonas citri pv. punicae str. LMG 859]|nr:UPF0126 domain protein [Xanthomonas citri pv. punicae str. LMG 859]
MATVLFLLDLLGTFVFALSGATVAVRNRLDLFGVLVLSCAAAVSGGIVRDVLIGATPPAALVQPQYLLVACLAGVAGFYWHAAVERLRNPVQIFDAAGLALFAVYGTSKALDYHLTPLSATLLGMLSGIGGGIARDLLVARTPVVLQAELYAVAACRWRAGRGRARPGCAAGLVVGDRRRRVLRPALHGDPLRLASAGGALAGVAIA